MAVLFEEGFGAYDGGAVIDGDPERTTTGKGWGKGGGEAPRLPSRDGVYLFARRGGAWVIKPIDIPTGYWVEIVTLAKKTKDELLLHSPDVQPLPEPKPNRNFWPATGRVARCVAQGFLWGFGALLALLLFHGLNWI